MQDIQVYNIPESDNPYTIIDNRILKATFEELPIDLTAKGLYIYLRSFINYKFRVERIANSQGMTIGSVNKAMKQLENAGLLIRQRVNNYNGVKGFRYIYFLFGYKDINNFEYKKYHIENQLGISVNDFSVTKISVTQISTTEIQDTVYNNIRNIESTKDLNYNLEKKEILKEKKENPDSDFYVDSSSEVDSNPEVNQKPMIKSTEMGQKSLKDSEAISLHSKPSKMDLNAITELFDRFWSIYPKKVARKVAFQSFRRALQSGASIEDILSSLDVYINKVWNKTKMEFIPHASTWLNQERWNDDIRTGINRVGYGSTGRMETQSGKFSDFCD